MLDTVSYNALVWGLKGNRNNIHATFIACLISNNNLDEFAFRDPNIPPLFRTYASI
jgi:hypothetical protein